MHRRVYLLFVLLPPLLLLLLLLLMMILMMESDSQGDSYRRDADVNMHYDGRLNSVVILYFYAAVLFGRITGHTLRSVRAPNSKTKKLRKPTIHVNFPQDSSNLCANFQLTGSKVRRFVCVWLSDVRTSPCLHSHVKHKLSLVYQASQSTVPINIIP